MSFTLSKGWVTSFVGGAQNCMVPFLAGLAERRAVRGGCRDGFQGKMVGHSKELSGAAGFGVGGFL